MNRVRITKVSDMSENPRDGYVYRRLVAHGEDTPFNFLHISVSERHASRRVLHGVRNYYVVSGEGIFTIEGEVFDVETGMLITIWPKEVYSYEGKMELIEFNVADDGKIEHEDVE